MKSAELFIDGAMTCPVLVADTYWTRLRGMLFRNPLPPALVLVRTTSVHGAWMTQALDIAMLDDAGVVLATGVLQPWRLSSRQRGTHSVLEAPVGSFETWGLGVGSRIALVPHRE